MPGFDAYLQQQFPGIRITSGARDPNSRLGRANPKSWHNQGKAWDVAPIEGMDYQDFVNRIGQDYNVLEARDEVRNPSKHATGPHWHVAVDGRKEAQPMNGLADLMKGVYPMAQQEQGGLAALLSQGAIQPQVAPMQVPQANIPDPNKRPVWKDILGGVLDTIAIAGGRQGGYWPAIQRERELETDGRKRLEEYQRQRQDKMSDWMTQQDYQRQNPDPPAMLRDLQTWQAMTPEQRAAYAAMQDVRNPIAVSGPQGTYRVPRGYGQQPTNSIPQGTVEDGYVYVGGDPGDPNSWRPQ